LLEWHGDHLFCLDLDSSTWSSISLSSWIKGILAPHSSLAFLLLTVICFKFMFLFCVIRFGLLETKQFMKAPFQTSPLLQAQSRDPHLIMQQLGNLLHLWLKSSGDSKGKIVKAIAQTNPP
jgi:hypothetical protein